MLEKVIGWGVVNRLPILVICGFPWEALTFLTERRNVILIGNSGTGKTHMAIAVGIIAYEDNYRVSFQTAAGLINEMVEARNENRLSLYLLQFKKIDLLIFDELGYVTFDLAGADAMIQNMNGQSFRRR